MRTLGRCWRLVWRWARRFVTWPLRGQGGIWRVVKAVVVIVAVVMVVHALGDAWDRADRYAHRHVVDGIIAAVALGALVILGAILGAVRRERRQRADDKTREVRSHVPASAAVAITGALLGALPSALIAQPVVAGTATAAIVAGAVTGALALAGMQRGRVPWWSLAWRTAWRRHQAVVAGLGLLAVGVLAVAVTLRVPGGDAGAVVGAVALVLAEADSARVAARETTHWWKIAVAAMGVDRVGHVEALPPRAADREAAEVAGAGPAPWGARVTCARHVVAGQVSSGADAIGSVVGDEWDVRADLAHRRITVRPRPLLPTSALAPTDGAGGQWELPIGVGRGGQPLVWDVTADPHALVTGQTGSGKTVLIVGAAMQAALRGWQVAVVDATKGALDYSDLDPWACIVARELPEAAAAVEWAYSEVRRRRALLAQHGAAKVPDLPAGVRPPPLLLVLDEYFSLVARLASKTDLAKRDNAMKDLIADTVSRVAREARYADVHLILGAQRPDAAVFAGELKANVGARILCGPADGIARSMALRNADGAPVPPKGSKGRAVVETETMDAAEVQLYLVATSPADGSRKRGAPLPSEVLADRPHATRVPLVVPHDDEPDTPPSRHGDAPEPAAPSGDGMDVSEAVPSRRPMTPPPLPPLPVE